MFSISSENKQIILPYILVFPAFIVLIVFLVYPSVYNFYLSILNWRLTTPHISSYAGISNYIKIINDESFWTVTRFSLGFTFITVLLEFFIGIMSALILYGVIKGRRLITSFLLTPYMVAPIAVGLGWRMIWDYDIGIINYILEFIGIERIMWLAETWPAFWAIVICEVWRSTPFVTMILLAGITALPNDIFEAAHMDGASRRSIFFKITFPLILPPLIVSLMFQTIFKLRLFDIPFILTEGGPGNSTMPYGLYINDIYFRYGDVGKAAAICVILFFLGALLSMVYIQFLKDNE